MVISVYMKSDDLRVQYDEMLPRLDRLGGNMRAALEQFLEQHAIDVLSVSYRVKQFSSFRDKIQRKRYDEPFAQVPDLCGVRIITFNPSDLNRIDELIRAEFNVDEIVDQSTKLTENQFGYRSNHYVVTLKPEWLGAPNYRGLGDLRVEIQVRTILMHAWANLSHRLSYKSADQAPLELRRRIFQLSALFEMADEEFDRLATQKRALQQALVDEARIDNRGFDMAQPLNADSLQAYLDYRFPDRGRSSWATAELLSEMTDVGLTLEDVDAGFRLTRDRLAEQELENMAAVRAHDDRNEPGEGRWYQVGVVRHILDVTNDAYWETRRTQMPDYIASLIQKYRDGAAARKPATA